MFLDRDHRTRLVTRVSTRTRALSKGPALGPKLEKLKRHRRRLAGAALTLGSIALGIWAYEAAQAESLGTWLRAHPPSRAAWKHALESRGLAELREPRALQRALRSLPAMLDEPGMAWTSDDGAWVAIFATELASDSAQTGVTVYCLDCRAKPGAWSPQGRGWSAYDPVLAQADAAARARSAPITSRRRAIRLDPRELRF